jgi:catalase
MVGIVVDPAGDLGAVAEVRRTLMAAGMLPLLVGPHGGDLGEGLVAQRTFATGRSVELDALLVAGAAPPAADALVHRDSKAGETAPVSTDPRVVLLVEECFRHAKPVGAWGAGQSVLEALGIDGAGVVTAPEPGDVVESVGTLLGAHRVWERFGAVVA